jgi:hypothetical protein
MSYSISTSDLQEDFWSVRSTTISLLERLLSERYEQDKEMVDEFIGAMICNGICLDSVLRENRNLAERMSKALLVLAKDIAALNFTEITEDNLNDSIREEYPGIFSKLHDILLRFRTTHGMS